MSNTSRITRNPKARLALLKQEALDAGVPYSSARDAHFRGELAVFKFGSSDRHAHWYVDRDEFRNWVMSRRDQLQSA